MAAEVRLVLMLGLPLAAVAMTLLLGRRANLREAVQLAIGTLLFVVTASLSDDVFFAGRRPEVELWSLTPGFVLRLQLEPLGMLFALVASGLWIVTTAYAMGYMRAHDEQNQTRFYVCFCAAIFAAIGAALAGNLLTLFVFYEFMTLSTYPLVTHHGTEQAKRGGRTYLSVLICSSIAFLLMAIAWTWALTGSLDFVEGGILAEAYQSKRIGAAGLALLLGLFAFGTAKAALMPLHRWLPAAMVAPTPVSALLHAVAVVKVGVFSILKVSLYIFSPQLLRDSGCSVWLMYVAGTSVLAASLIAMRQDNLKRRLAYSTVSQLAYISLGAALAQPASIIGGAMHIAMHAMGKITLFFCAGGIYVATHKTEISQMRGLGRQMPFTMGAFFVGSISIIGLPPCGGVWSKWFLARGAVEAGHPGLMMVLMVSSVLNVAYLLPVAITAFFGSPEDSPPTHDGSTQSTIREAPLLCVIAPWITAAGCVFLFFAAQQLYLAMLPLGEIGE